MISISKRRSRRSKTPNTKEALIAIYKKLRPGEPATEESGTTLLRNFFYDPRRYDLVGRYKLNKKLSWENRLKGHRTEGPIVDRCCSARTKKIGLTLAIRFCPVLRSVTYC